VFFNIDSFQNNIKFQGEDLYEKQKEVKIIENMLKKKEYSRSFSGFDLSQDWNLDVLDDHLKNNLHRSIDILKGNEKEETTKDKFIKKESFSLNESENVYRSNKKDDFSCIILL
jgi:hypothetical protein